MNDDASDKPDASHNPGASHNRDASHNAFSTQREFQQWWLDCVEKSSQLLQAFDPDFSVVDLGGRRMDAALRSFLRRGGRIELAMHASRHLEHHAPRFLILLRDYGHQIACKVTPKSLRELTDSFLIGDQVHLVRRFHSDHMRGEASTADGSANDICIERFSSIWKQSDDALHATILGL
jgi:hypothetical protein